MALSLSTLQSLSNKINRQKRLATEQEQCYETLRNMLLELDKEKESLRSKMDQLQSTLKSYRERFTILNETRARMLESANLAREKVSQALQEKAQRLEDIERLDQHIITLEAKHKISWQSMKEKYPVQFDEAFETDMSRLRREKLELQSMCFTLDVNNEFSYSKEKWDLWKKMCIHLADIYINFNLQDKSHLSPPSSSEVGSPEELVDEEDYYEQQRNKYFQAQAQIESNNASRLQSDRASTKPNSPDQISQAKTSASSSLERSSMSSKVKEIQQGIQFHHAMSQSQQNSLQKPSIIWTSMNQPLTNFTYGSSVSSENMISKDIQDNFCNERQQVAPSELNDKQQDHLHQNLPIAGELGYHTFTNDRQQNVSTFSNIRQQNQEDLPISRQQSPNNLSVDNHQNHQTFSNDRQQHSHIFSNSRQQNSQIFLNHRQQDLHTFSSARQQDSPIFAHDKQQNHERISNDNNQDQSEICLPSVNSTTSPFNLNVPNPQQQTSEIDSSETYSFSPETNSNSFQPNDAQASSNNIQPQLLHSNLTHSSEEEHMDLEHSETVVELESQKNQSSCNNEETVDFTLMETSDEEIENDGMQLTLNEFSTIRKEAQFQDDSLKETSNSDRRISENKVFNVFTNVPESQLATKEGIEGVPETPIKPRDPGTDASFEEQFTSFSLESEPRTLEFNQKTEIDSNKNTSKYFSKNPFGDVTSQKLHNPAMKTLRTSQDSENNQFVPPTLDRNKTSDNPFIPNKEERRSFVQTLLKSPDLQMFTPKIFNKQPIGIAMQAQETEVIETRNADQEIPFNINSEENLQSSEFETDRDVISKGGITDKDLGTASATNPFSPHHEPELVQSPPQQPTARVASSTETENESRTMLGNRDNMNSSFHMFQKSPANSPKSENFLSIFDSPKGADRNPGQNKEESSSFSFFGNNEPKKESSSFFQFPFGSPSSAKSPPSPKNNFFSACKSPPSPKVNLFSSTPPTSSPQNSFFSIFATQGNESEEEAGSSQPASMFKFF